MEEASSLAEIRSISPRRRGIQLFTCEVADYGARRRYECAKMASSLDLPRTLKIGHSSKTSF